MRWSIDSGFYVGYADVNQMSMSIRIFTWLVIAFVISESTKAYKSTELISLVRQRIGDIPAGNSRSGHLNHWYNQQILNISKLILEVGYSTLHSMHVVQ